MSVVKKRRRNGVLTNLYKLCNYNVKFFIFLLCCVQIEDTVACEQFYSFSRNHILLWR